MLDAYGRYHAAIDGTMHRPDVHHSHRNKIIWCESVSVLFANFGTYILRAFLIERTNNFRGIMWNVAHLLVCDTLTRLFACYRHAPFIHWRVGELRALRYQGH